MIRSILVPCILQSGHRWDATLFPDRERQEKFNKLMVIPTCYLIPFYQKKKNLKIWNDGMPLPCACSLMPCSLVYNLFPHTNTLLESEVALVPMANCRVWRAKWKQRNTNPTIKKPVAYKRRSRWNNCSWNWRSNTLLGSVAEMAALLDLVSEYLYRMFLHLYNPI